jgi:fatty acid desaturase
MGPAFRDPADRWPTLAALTYSATAYVGGWTLLLTAGPWLALLGVLLLGHGLITAAYLLHETIHYAVFRDRAPNERLAAVLAWLTGACYASFAELQRKHLRHHADRADVLIVDHRELLAAAPAWSRRLVLALEWAYIPAVDLLLRAYALVHPFRTPGRAGQRRRVAGVAAVRWSALAAVAWVAPPGALGYLLAQGLMIHVLRFMDAYQHTYEVITTPDGEAPPRDQRPPKTAEYPNTFSNLLSVRWPRLNWLTLNFAYHNAHHVNPVVGWARLPALHDELFGRNDPQILPAGRLLASYHRHRVRRIRGEAAGTEGAGLPLGAVGVSFLVPV